MKKVNTSLIVRFCLPQFAVGFFNDLSDAVIRFVPIDINNKKYASVHNDDENFLIDKLGLVVKFYKELLKNYR